MKTQPRFRETSDVASVEASQARQRTGLVTLLFTDIVDSTALKQKLGDRGSALIFGRHHQIVREVLREFPMAEEIETAGDSFLLVFATPSDAVQFSLLLKSRMRGLQEELGTLVEDRVGIHVGEVVIGADTESLKPKDLYGIQIDTCARVMGLGRGGQILMTRAVFDSARQVLKGEDIEGIGALEWLNHGPYLLKGLEEPIEIGEVREEGQAGGGAPPSSEKAQRQARPDEEPVLGWRPAVGQAVPNTRWQLEQKLGEGGFGEVWLGRNTSTKEYRVFKFCFQADRVRFLKRELTLFRLLKERVGDHPNIVRLHDVYLDHPPFYVEMDYVEGKDLRTWGEDHGGIGAVPLALKLELVAQAADGLQAAHEAGVIHRDIKPGNILIADSHHGDPGGVLSKSKISVQKLAVKLTDFGIGQVVSEDYLQGITGAGFTQTILSESSSSQSGTQMYMAPELMAGKPASTRSDIYSLGVVLYQVLVGDFRRPVTMDWGEQIEDPLLREDLERCFAGDAQRRFAAAGLLAERLRALPERRSELERCKAEKAALEKEAYRRGVIRTISLTWAIIAVISGLAIFSFSISRREKRERDAAQRNLYVATMNMAQQAWEQNNAGRLRQLLAEGAGYPERGFEWNYWQRQAHLERATLRGHLGSVWSAAFSGDGKWIVTGSDDQTAKVWDVESGQERLTLKGHTAAVRAVACSPDNQRIATGSWDQTVRIWDSASGVELRVLKGHQAAVRAVAFSPDGRRLATGSWDNTARIWDVETGEEIVRMIGHKHWIVSVAFSRDGKRIATGSQDWTAKVWDAATGQEVRSIGGHGREVNSVAFSPDGRRLATSGVGQAAKVWNLEDGKEAMTLEGHESTISSVAYSMDGKRIVTSSFDQTVRVWDAVTGGLLMTLKGHSGPIGMVTFSPNGRMVVSSGGDQTAKIWETEKHIDGIKFLGHTDQVRSVSFSPDGERLATASRDQTAKIWEAKSGKELRTLEGHLGWVNAAVFSPDGERLATASEDQTVKVWETTTGRRLLDVEPHRAAVLTIAFAPDGKQMATGSKDGTARILEAATGREIAVLTGHAARVLQVAFSPDGQRLATGSEDSTVKVWDARSGREVLTFKGHEGPVHAVVFSPDGQRIISGSTDRTVKVWRVRDGLEIQTLEGHTGAVRSVRMTQDGGRIVTGSEDQTARIWEASSGKEMLSLAGHGAGIRAVAISPDGRSIVTASEDHTVRLWETASEEQVAAWQKDEQAALAQMERRQQEGRSSTTVASASPGGGDPGAITRWLVLAPVRLSVRDGTKALDTELIGPENALRPREGDRVRIKGQEAIWRAVQLNDVMLDFNQFVGELVHWSVAYAVCYIQSDAVKDELIMRVASDDQAKVYLNGEPVYRHAISRAYYADQDMIGGVRLQAGINVLIFKVVNETAGWQGAVRFQEKGGEPVRGIRVLLEPEAN